MRNKKVARQNDCTLNKVEIVDNRAIPDKDMKIVLEDLGFASLEDIHDQTILDPFNELVGFLDTLEEIAKNLREVVDDSNSSRPKGKALTSTRDQLTTLIEDIDASESTLSVALEDLNDVFDDTSMSFSEIISAFDESVKGLLSVTEEPMVFSIYKDPAFQAQMEARRMELESSIDQGEADLEQAENDYFQVLEQIRAFYERKSGNLSSLEQELVDKIRQLKKMRGKASKRQRALYNRQRRELNEQLKTFQQTMDLGNLRQEQENLWQEMEDLENEVEAQKDELLNGDEMRASRGSRGVFLLENHYSTLNATMIELGSALEKMLELEKAGSVKKIDIPYLDAACLLLHTESKIKPKMVQDFLKNSLLGNGCMTRKEWSDNKFFNEKTWKNLAKEMANKYGKKYGDVSVVVDGIKAAAFSNKLPRDFAKFLVGKL